MEQAGDRQADRVDPEPNLPVSWAQDRPLRTRFYPVTSRMPIQRVTAWYRAPDLSSGLRAPASALHLMG